MPPLFDWHCISMSLHVDYEMQEDGLWLPLLNETIKKDALALGNLSFYVDNDARSPEATGLHGVYLNLWFDCASVRARQSGKAVAPA